MFHGRKLHVKGRSTTDSWLPPSTLALQYHFLNPWPFAGHIFSLEVVDLVFKRLKAQDAQAVLLPEYKLQLTCWGKNEPVGAAL